MADQRHCASCNIEMEIFGYDERKQTREMVICWGLRRNWSLDGIRRMDGETWCGRDGKPVWRDAFAGLSANVGEIRYLSGFSTLRSKYL